MIEQLVWRRCGHPRTPENTIHHGKGDRRCRECRTKIKQEYDARRRAALPVTANAYDSDGKRIWLSML